MNMTFGDALSAMKAGKTVTRSRCEMTAPGKGWVIFLKEWPIETNLGGCLESQNNPPATAPAITIRSASGHVFCWGASHEDMLAEDWRIVSDGAAEE